MSVSSDNDKVIKGSAEAVPQSELASYSDLKNENVDEALAIFIEVEHAEVHVDDNKLRWKIDTHVLPLL